MRRFSLCLMLAAAGCGSPDPPTPTPTATPIALLESQARASVLEVQKQPPTQLINRNAPPPTPHPTPTRPAPPPIHHAAAKPPPRAEIPHLPDEKYPHAAPPPVAVAPPPPPPPRPIPDGESETSHRFRSHFRQHRRHRGGEPFPPQKGQSLTLGLYSVASTGSGARLPVGGVDSHWRLVKFERAPGGPAIGREYSPGSSLYTVTSVFGLPALSLERSGGYVENAPVNGYYTYETHFHGGIRHPDIVCNITVDDAILSASLNDRPVDLQFDGEGTVRTLNGRTSALYHERASFRLTQVQPGSNVLRILTVNQWLDGKPNPHSFGVEFHDANEVQP